MAAVNLGNCNVFIQDDFTQQGIYVASNYFSLTIFLRGIETQKYYVIYFQARYKIHIFAHISN